MNGKEAGDNPADTPESGADTADTTEPIAAAPDEPDAPADANDEQPPEESARRRRRRAAQAAGDSFGPEPPWLQSGSASRTIVGISVTLAIVVAVAATGWWLFTPPAPASESGEESGDTVCGTESHADRGEGVSPPGNVDSVPPRQTATVETNFGTVSVLLFGDVAQCGVGNFGRLASRDFYNDTECFRLTTRQTDPTATLRCGDPTGTGSGGPGYRFISEDAYTDQTGRDYVALINNKSGKAGSSFAFIRGESKPTASLSVIGQVIAGHTVLDQIGASAGLEEYDDAPPEPVVIEKVTIEEGTVTVPPSQEEEQSPSQPADPTQPEDGGSGLPDGSEPDIELPTEETS